MTQKIYPQERARSLINQVNIQSTNQPPPLSIPSTGIAFIPIGPTIGTLFHLRRLPARAPTRIIYTAIILLTIITAMMDIITHSIGLWITTTFTPSGDPAIEIITQCCETLEPSDLIPLLFLYLEPFHQEKQPRDSSRRASLLLLQRKPISNLLPLQLFILYVFFPTIRMWQRRAGDGG